MPSGVRKLETVSKAATQMIHCRSSFADSGGLLEASCSQAVNYSSLEVTQPSWADISDEALFNFDAWPVPGHTGKLEVRTKDEETQPLLLCLDALIPHFGRFAGFSDGHPTCQRCSIGFRVGLDLAFPCFYGGILCTNCYGHEDGTIRRVAPTGPQGALHTLGRDSEDKGTTESSSLGRAIAESSDHGRPLPCSSLLSPCLLSSAAESSHQGHPFHSAVSAESSLQGRQFSPSASFSYREFDNDIGKRFGSLEIRLTALEQSGQSTSLLHHLDVSDSGAEQIGLLEKRLTELEQSGQSTSLLHHLDVSDSVAEQIRLLDKRLTDLEQSEQPTSLLHHLDVSDSGAEQIGLLEKRLTELELSGQSTSLLHHLDVSDSVAEQIRFLDKRLTDLEQSEQPTSLLHHLDVSDSVAVHHGAFDVKSVLALLANYVSNTQLIEALRSVLAATETTIGNAASSNLKLMSDQFTESTSMLNEKVSSLKTSLESFEQRLSDALAGMHSAHSQAFQPLAGMHSAHSQAFQQNLSHETQKNLSQRQLEKLVRHVNNDTLDEEALINTCSSRSQRKQHRSDMIASAEQEEQYWNNLLSAVRDSNTCLKFSTFVHEQITHESLHDQSTAHKGARQPGKRTNFQSGQC